MDYDYFRRRRRNVPQAADGGQPSSASYFSSPPTPFLPPFHEITTLLPALGATRNPRMRLRSFVISPNNRYLVSWRLILASLVILMACIPPNEMGLPDVNWCNGAWCYISIAENVFNALLAIDIIITMFVAYVDATTHLLIDDHRRISLRYATSTLAMDVISAIPAEVVWFISPLPLKEYGLLSLLRLWRLKRVSDMFARLEKNISLSYVFVRCSKLISVTIFLVNRAACFFYMLAAYNDDPFNTWIGQSMPSGVDFRHLSIWSRYVISLYWSVTMFSTVGFGDFHAVNTKERLACTIYMLFNVAAITYVIGHVSQLLGDVPMKTKCYRDKVQAATNFTQRNRLPSYLEKEMMSHLSLNYRTNLEGLQEQEMLDSLPKATRSSILKYLFYPLLENVSLFREISDKLLFQLVSKMRVEYFSPNRDVILQNETPSDFYVIVTGAVEFVIDGVEEVVGEARRGELCGEIGVICHMPQPYTVRTKRLTQVLRLKRTAFRKIIKANVGVGGKIVENLDQHMKELTREGILRNISFNDMIARARMHLKVVAPVMEEEEEEENPVVGEENQVVEEEHQVVEEEHQVEEEEHPVVEEEHPVEEEEHPAKEMGDASSSQQAAKVPEKGKAASSVASAEKEKGDASSPVACIVLVNVTCKEKGDQDQDKLVLPRTFEELKQVGMLLYGAPFVKVWHNGNVINDIQAVRNGDLLVYSRE